MRRAVFAVFALVFSACAPATLPCACPQPPQQRAPVSKPPAQAAASPAEKAAPAADVATIDLAALTIPIPERARCVVSGATPTVLGISMLLEHGVTFGTLGRADSLRVHLTFDDDDEYVIEATLPSVTIRALVARSEVPLHATRAAAFEFLRPRSSAHLNLLSVSSADIELYVRVPPAVSLAAQRRDFDGDDTVDGTLSCSDLSLDVQAFDPLSDMPEPIGQGELRGPRVLLAESPGKGPVASVSVEELQQSRFASVHARRPGFLQIALPVDDAVLVGWIQETQLKPGTAELAKLDEGASAPPLGSSDPAPRRIVVCPHAVPFRAVVRERAETVGIIHPHTIVPILASSAGRREIDLEDYGLSRDEGTVLSVADSDLRGCREQAP